MMKTVVITGSTRGIGYGLAESFLALGCAVTISGRQTEALQTAYKKLAEKFGTERLLACPCDVRDGQQLQALWDAACGRFGSVDIWINNAGTAHPSAGAWQLPAETIRSVIETNLIGAVLGTQVALNGMLLQGHGAIYNMEGLGSSGGRKVKGLSIYGTTKAGLAYFDQALAQEVAGTGIITGAIRPGMTYTELVPRQFEGRQADWEKFKPIMNILSDRVETISPWITRRVLDNRKNGAMITWLNPIKIGMRFLTAPFKKRRVVE
jgi:NAD(P)-dependent dehydrogenase (short-subunit alcohol dehydrogenase family)